jgi:hypothetical protein
MVNNKTELRAPQVGATSDARIVATNFKCEVRTQMEDTIFETIENVITPEPEVEAPPDATQVDDTALETQLTEKIKTLWSEHKCLSADHKTTAKELRKLRVALAERLFEMKSLLSRPGRGGEWRGWLRERKIPRSTADRLCARHAETVGADVENVLSGATSEPTKSDVLKFSYTLWPRIQKVVTTYDSVLIFLGAIAAATAVRYEHQEEGLMIFKSVNKAMNELPGSASVPDLFPQPFDSGDANSEDVAAKPVMATTAIEQVAGYGDSDAGAMA